MQTHSWGVDVSIVEIKDVEIPEAMQRAMARKAEAERERRAKVINARGEMQASGEVPQAADELSKSPTSLQLRYLQMPLELGANQNSTVVFPLPMDILAPSFARVTGTDRWGLQPSGRSGPTCLHGGPDCPRYGAAGYVTAS